jgi:hypothetical protein
MFAAHWLAADGRDMAITSDSPAGLAARFAVLADVFGAAVESAAGRIVGMVYNDGRIVLR